MTLEDGRRLFGKVHATSHERADRWYRFGRTILYGQLEDETPVGPVRRLATYEDYALRLLADHNVRVARTYGVVELPRPGVHLVDVSGLQVRPSPWRRAVDLFNMLLVLALRTDPERVYARATRVFTPTRSPRRARPRPASPSPPSSRPS